MLAKIAIVILLLLIVFFYYTNWFTIKPDSPSTQASDTSSDLLKTELSSIKQNLNEIKAMLVESKKIDGLLDEKLNRLLKTDMAPISTPLTATKVAVTSLAEVLTSVALLATENKTKPNIFDLSRALEPEGTYAAINCRDSADFYGVRATLCVHDLSRDVHVSGSIWRDGVWERHIMSMSFH